MIRKKGSYLSRVKFPRGVPFCKSELNVFVSWRYSFMNLSVHDLRSCHTGSDFRSRGMDLRAVSSRCF